MKTKLILLTIGLLGLAIGASAQQVSPSGTVPPYLIRTYDPLDTAQIGQMLAIKDYLDGDTLLGYVEVRYLGGGVLTVDGDTLATLQQAQQPPGPYASDFLAGEDGILIGEMYYVGAGNIYGMPVGFVRVRLSVLAGAWAGQDGAGNDVLWQDDVGGYWVGD